MRSRLGEMAEAEIDAQRFAELVTTAFPQLLEGFREWQGFVHLQMAEFLDLTISGINDGDWATVQRCLQVADPLLRLGNDSIRNAVYVSYLEGLPRDEDVRTQINEMMSPQLRQGWTDILAYLADLLRRENIQ
jgi:hypothetical protein